MNKYVRVTFFLFLTLFVLWSNARSQDSASLYDRTFQLPDKFFGTVRNKSEKMQQQLQRSTEKYLTSLARKEKKLQRKLARKDSTAAKEVFGNVDRRYDSLRKALNNPAAKFSNVYSGRLDSMTTTLQFMQGNLSEGDLSGMQAKSQSAIKQYGEVQGKLNQTNFIQSQLKQRQEVLKQKLKNSGLSKELRKYQDKVSSYRTQIKAYKDELENPAKIEAALLKVANKIPAFQKFFATHSQLGRLFRLPQSNETASENLNGMQTRELLLRDMGQRFGGAQNVQGMVNRSIGTAQTSLEESKNKLTKNNSDGDLNMPDFKGNTEKTKSFLKRIELGTNIQNTPSSYFFPTTTDVGLSIGYKLDTKTIAGIGTSYRMGWGKDFRHIVISHQGIGFRCFAERKAKGSFWFSGGGELNYRSAFQMIEQLKNYSAWQKSALAGINKKYKLKNYKGEVKLLYDFLWKSQVPQTQPILVRFGYTL